MALNMTMSPEGVSRFQALPGQQPLELYDFENNGTSASAPCLDTTPFPIEQATHLRLHSKDAVIQATVEDRIARARNTRVHQYKPEELAKLTEGARVDLWREPLSKDDPGWRGPAVTKARLSWTGEARHWLCRCGTSVITSATPT